MRCGRESVCAGCAVSVEALWRAKRRRASCSVAAQHELRAAQEKSPGWCRSQERGVGIKTGGGLFQFPKSDAAMNIHGDV